jgi:hypothetical protein
MKQTKILLLFITFNIQYDVSIQIAYHNKKNHSSDASLNQRVIFSSLIVS